MGSHREPPPDSVDPAAGVPEDSPAPSAPVLPEEGQRGAGHGVERQGIGAEEELPERESPGVGDDLPGREGAWEDAL